MNVPPELGNGTRNIPPADCLKMFQESGHLPLTAKEGLALTVQNPNILKEAYLNFLGSPCGSEYMASLWLSDSRPRFDRNLASAAYHDWLSPFCVGRSYDRKQTAVEEAPVSAHCYKGEVSGVIRSGC